MCVAGFYGRAEELHLLRRSLVYGVETWGLLTRMSFWILDYQIIIFFDNLLSVARLSIQDFFTVCRLVPRNCGVLGSRGRKLNGYWYPIHLQGVNPGVSHHSSCHITI